jgi:homogentisate 1,2-dioxygenase
MPLPLHRSASQRCCAAPRNLFRLRPIATLGGCGVGCSDGRRPLSYLSGFGNHLHSEALRGAVPRGQNSPQVCPYGLYAEKLSGTAFTAPRHANKQSWLYRIRPSVVHQPWTAIDAGAWLSSFTTDEATTPNQLRWLPPEVVSAGAAQGEGREHTFVEGMTTLAGAGEPSLRAGLGMHVYTATGSMGDSCLVNSDGDMLLVPQQGTLRIRTEFGVLEVEPNEIAVLGRGMKFSVDLVHEPAAEAAEAEEAPLHRGYVLEVYGRHFELPELGPIGSNGLANAAGA